MVRHPFQKLCCIQPVDGEQPFLIAASGPVLSTFDLRDGRLLSQWPQPGGKVTGGNGAATANDGEDPPAKRRKVEVQPPAVLSKQTTDEPVDITSDGQKTERKNAQSEASQSANVSHIVATSDGATVITATTADKTIRVFDVRPGGVLGLQSQRSMPKKVCGIVLTPDEKDILVGDKFGDIYLLPLHPREDFVPKKVEQDQPERAYGPAASELTVHTQGNLKALQQQRRQKTVPPRKEGPNFQLKLLLGHVSSLTDVAIAEVQDGLKRKQYILSADRDEHIRVSRGVSQAHIIENYCLGHREFVSKLCIAPWNPEYLVTGSAEPSLKVYHFSTGRLLDEELFDAAVRQDINSVLSADDGERSVGRLAVSSIWPIHFTVAGNAPHSRHPPHLLLVALEGLPILLSYVLSEQGQLRHHHTLTLAGNVLDVGIGPALWDIVVSIDTVHKPGSVRVIRPEETPATEAFETFELFSNISNDQNGSSEIENLVDGPELRWEKTSLAMLLNDSALHCEIPDAPVEQPSKAENTYSVLGETLYGLENVRKKRGLHVQEDDAEDLGDDISVAPHSTT
ncbi:hypothetical protein A1O1_07651 [Capronia coronata CBS 617.96]|uniref:Uncharacterized protein n=1 Tax=Capronia coronata CBS 617.96 TaxID=1182541 RepID=W9XM24_9EURO|nr:uncharacterized protein A1O1_07651 [Capronia coronata CBS 617.96]EXJ81587.1 hypothetical protein A1O1_07651 [Capronia coronata CBS 617.96]